jgi:hypothetical protein
LRILLRQLPVEWGSATRKHKNRNGYHQYDANRPDNLLQWPT